MKTFTTSYSQSGITIISPKVAVIGHNLTANVHVGSADYSIVESVFLLRNKLNPNEAVPANVDAITAIGDGKDDNEKLIEVTLPAELLPGRYVLRITVRDAGNNNNVFLVEKNILVNDISKLGTDFDREMLKLVRDKLKGRLGGSGLDTSAAEEFASAGLQIKYATFDALREYEQELLSRIDRRAGPFKQWQMNINDMSNL